MKKKFLIILLTVLLFFSAMSLGVTTVFRVDSVSVEATVVSDQAKTEVAQLKKDLEKLYEDEGIFFVKRSKADSLLENYPYFRITEFSKSYPNRLEITVVEDAEVYAVSTGKGGYYILSGGGIVLDVREGIQNRIDGGDLLFLDGATGTGTKGKPFVGNNVYVQTFVFCRQLDVALGGVRRNVTQAKAHEEGATFYQFQMREGVIMVVDNPANATEAKVAAAVAKYFSLSDEERLKGSIRVFDDVENTLPTYNAE